MAYVGKNYFYEFIEKLSNKITILFVKKEAGKGLSTNDFTTAEKRKLQELSTIMVDSSMSSSSVNPVQNKIINAALAGKADMDSTGKVLASQLPSYVDDVLEYDAQNGFPAAGEAGKIYIAKDTNKTYRWSGSAYVEISASLALGETSGTAYRGDKGKTAYDHSQIAHAPSNAKANVQADWNVTDISSDAFVKNKPNSLPANGGNANTVGGFTVGTNVPVNAKFTDTTYGVATQSVNGLMSASDKTKLDGLTEASTADIDDIIAGLFV